MYQNCCKKCGSISLHTEVKGNNTGLYCDDCGSWIKWLSKEELRAFEYNKQKDCSDIIKRLRTFTDYLEKTIDKEMEQAPLSPEDSIRKSSYCLALERDKNAIQNIINGREFNDIEK